MNSWKYITPEQEIRNIAETYRVSESEEARRCYSQYINLVILEQPISEQSKLEKMWEWEIE